MIRRLFWFHNKEIIDKYYIDDLVDSDTEVLFILESPSKLEILLKAPASGSTGKKITNKLLNLEVDRGFGELKINKRLDNKTIGVMNVSQIPMQYTDYSLKDLNKIKRTEKIKKLSELKKSITSTGYITYNFRKYKDIKSEIIDDISCSFCYRLFNYANYSKTHTIVLSGNIAKAFFDNCCFSKMIEHFFNIKRITHLSRSSKHEINKISKLI